MARKRRRASASTSAADPLQKRAAYSIVLELPEELILDILLGLPAKSLFRFRCVCKLWDALFYDPHFLKQHSNSLHRQFAHRKVMIKMMCRDHGAAKSFGVPTLCRDKSGAKGQYLRLPISDFHPSVVGCCNGVVCLRTYRKGETIYFWNPLSNQCIKLPYTFCMYYDRGYSHGNVFGFGFDDSTNEFKLVRIFLDYSSKPSKWAVEVYGMWEGSRKRISDYFPYGHPSDGRPFRSGVCVNGALHFVASIPMGHEISWAIVALDIAKETFRPQLLLPDQLDKLGQYFYEIKLCCVGELLCCMSSCYGDGKDTHDVWIMKEYGVKESWIKLLTIPFLEGRRSLPCLPLYYSEINGEFLMIYRGRLVLYRSGDDSIQDLEISPSYQYYFDAQMCNTYVESLFTPSVLMRLRGESNQQQMGLKIDGDIDRNTGVTTWRTMLRQRRTTK